MGSELTGATGFIKDQQPNSKFMRRCDRCDPLAWKIMAMITINDDAWLHVDDTCCVLNKPAGLPSVPGLGELAHGSLAQQVQQRYADARVVHRLDMATSGLILMARGADWQRAYSRLFAERRVQKRYLAVVHGLLAQDEGQIDLPLIADWPNRPKQKVDTVTGKSSLTLFRVLSRDPSTYRTRLELQPVTGRSHQLRVHLQAIGHPIVGDRLYAPFHLQNESHRLLLHSQALSVLHPHTTHTMLWRADPDF
jgi:tRNA pseudouridine32 synthase/23S rRNA pseudouridine746 synthase